ncbi:hypothetical protein EVAR_92630_1 [Eumeta japonica]|uniref:Uncharacterized protein n=1 Tax=Eumeta variegata TaxID=151549 RepID=A0A4C1SWW2_EUMVA|nr:hypothetical protein EVAR_92630_1 [Eumeta japonica]
MFRKGSLIIIFLSIHLVHGLRLKRTLKNFGTVLFRNADVNRNTWSKRQIGLLNARQILQQLVPPDDILDTVDENYIVALLQYFAKAYEAIRIVASDYETDAIMTEALSDVIGGYLKSRILPATRYGYYAGTINYDDAMKMIHLYEVIKTYLKTDGSAWHAPDDKKLSRLKINVAPKTKSALAYGCDQLALFEKCADGLTVPVPTVNWSPRSTVMFLPIKNCSLVEIDSPSSSHCVLNYYNTATTCLRNDRQNLGQFKNNFHNWLTKQVVPHLADDRLYVAFDGVLGLATDCSDIPECDDRPSSGAATRDSGSLTDKFCMFLLILAIEIVWCIPILICIKLYKKRMKKSKKNKGNDGSVGSRSNRRSGKKSTDVKTLFQNPSKSNDNQNEQQQWDDVETHVDVTYVRGCSACRSGKKEPRGMGDDNVKHESPQCVLLEKCCSAFCDERQGFIKGNYKSNEIKHICEISGKKKNEQPKIARQVSSNPLETITSFQSDRTSSIYDHLHNRTSQSCDYFCICKDADDEVTSSRDRSSSSSSERKATTVASSSLTSEGPTSGGTAVSSFTDKDSFVQRIERDTQTVKELNQKKIKQIRLECSTNENDEEDSCRGGLYRIKVRKAHRHFDKGTDMPCQGESAKEVRHLSIETAPHRKTNVQDKSNSNKVHQKPSKIPKRSPNAIIMYATINRKIIDRNEQILEPQTPVVRRTADDSALVGGNNGTSKLNETF